MITASTIERNRSGRRGTAPPGRLPHRVLAVRSLVAQLSWLLEGQPEWQEDRVVWRTANGERFAPEAVDISAAQRRLYKIRKYPFAGRAALGDPERWEEEALRRLAIADRLRRLRLPAPGDRDDPLALAALLAAEALCREPSVPEPPSRTLVALARRGSTLPSRVRDAFARIAADAMDASLPAPLRMLSALTLGAAERARRDAFVADPGLIPAASFPAPVRDALDRGLRRGLPDTSPGLTAALLSHGDGALTDRWERICRELPGDDSLISPFPLTVPALSALLLGTARTEDADRILAAMEMSAGRARALSQQLMSIRDVMPRLTPGETPLSQGRSDLRRQAAEALRYRRETEARKTGAAFLRLIRRSAEGTDLAETISAVLDFTEAVLKVSPPTDSVLRVLTAALRQARRLPAALRPTFLALACEYREHTWDIERSSLPRAVQQHRTGPEFSEWLELQWTRSGGPLYTLLQAAGDADVVRVAMRVGVGIYRGLARYTLERPLPDREHYRLLRDALRLFEDFPGADGLPRLLAILIPILHRFQTGTDARRALRPLLDALAPAARTPQRTLTAISVFTALLESSHTIDTQHRLTEALQDIACHAPGLLRFAERFEALWQSQSDEIAQAILEIDHSSPSEMVQPLVEALLALLSEEENSTGALTPLNALPVRLAAALGGDDPSRFLACLRVARLHLPEETGYEAGRLRGGLDAMRDICPGVRAPIAALFPTQPTRCIALLLRIGTATHLGGGGLAPLTEHRLSEGMSDSAESDDPLWEQLFAIAPAARRPAAALWYARWLLGLPDTVPPGIRRMMEETERRREELAFLERRCEDMGADAPIGLMARRDHLRLRFQSDDGDDVTRARLAAEIVQDLMGAVTEAQMAAVEALTENCYRLRLRQVVALPRKALRMTHDLENATLLSATVHTNRRLLLRLLRAHFNQAEGETDDWPRSHPANIAFLASLQKRGGDAALWQSDFPRSIPLGDRTVQLRMESDPLAVLQMGNYFRTCLSVASGFNAFSTIANAVEINKRVLYARDAASGQVLGRKLIGITKAWEMVGFYNYCSLPDGKEADALCAAMVRHCRDFAARCGIPLADEGDVPTLFAESWYDDGTIPWSEESPTDRRISSAALL